MPLDWVPREVAHPAADCGISSVRRSWVGIVVKRWIPAIGLNLRDAVTSILYVVPESRHVHGVGKNCSSSYNCDGPVRSVFHDETPENRSLNATRPEPWAWPRGRTVRLQRDPDLKGVRPARGGWRAIQDSLQTRQFRNR